jgi:hypothetical protein
MRISNRIISADTMNAFQSILSVFTNHDNPHNRYNPNLGFPAYNWGVRQPGVRY